MKKQATKIKICGLTEEKEANYLNQIHADFAGMVVFCAAADAASTPRPPGLQRLGI